MVKWVRDNTLPAFFLVTFALGLMLISAAAFTHGWFWGLLTTGLALIGGGHWVTYLKASIGGGQ